MFVVITTVCSTDRYWLRLDIVVVLGSALLRRSHNLWITSGRKSVVDWRRY